MTSWSRLNTLHLVAGSVGVLLFLGTGQFMDRELDHLRGMPDDLRTLYRSAHIYILFSALLNVALGTYLGLARSRAGVIVQSCASALVVVALALFAYGFFMETPAGTIERPMIRLGIGLSFWGVLLHGIASYADRSMGAMRPRLPDAS